MSYSKAKRNSENVAISLWDEITPTALGISVQQLMAMRDGHHRAAAIRAAAYRLTALAAKFEGSAS